MSSPSPIEVGREQGVSGASSNSQLAADLRLFSAKVRRVILSKDLSPAGQAAAVAMLTTMHLERIEAAAKALGQ